MQKIGDAMANVLKQRPDIAKKVNELQKLQSEMATSPTRYTILSTTSDLCPYRECDGSGLIYVRDNHASPNQMREKSWECKCLPLRRIAFATMPEEYRGLTINSFRTDWYGSDENVSLAILAKKIAGNFVTEFEEVQKLGKGLYFFSYTKGSGKTRLAASVANALVSRYKAPMIFMTTLGLLEEIKRTYEPSSPVKTSQVLETVKEIDLLILDDIGVERQTSWVYQVMYDILNYRMDAHKITIFTSNVKIEELEYDPEGRIRSRINKMAFPVHLPDYSIRDQLARQENEEMTKILFRRGG